MISIKEVPFLMLAVSLTWWLGLHQAVPGLQAAGLAGWERLAAGRQQSAPTPTAAGEELAVHSPAGGEALQGKVSILGTVTADDFVSYEVSFAYQADPTHTWFLIAQGSRPVEQGALAAWDTTTINDGAYRLRVTLFLSSGRTREVLLEGVRVRNYSPVETSTPAPTGESTPVLVRATPTATATPLPEFSVQERTPVALATNPVQVDLNQLAGSAGLGMAVVAGAIGIGGMYFGLKALLRR